MDYAVSCRGGSRCLTMAAKQCISQYDNLLIGEPSMNSKELYGRLCEACRLPRYFDGDYKDRAAEKFRLAARWWDGMDPDGIPEGFRRDMEIMPDGFNCPRAFGDWEAMMYDKYI